VGKDSKHGTTYELVGVPPWKQKTPMKAHFASKVVLFKETFKFKHVIIFIMAINYHWFYKVMCLIPKFGQ
jgi:hypothetical protein